MPAPLQRPTWTETPWVHDGDCGGPVYFDLYGGFCWQCGAGPLHPHFPPGGYYIKDHDYTGTGWPRETT